MKTHTRIRKTHPGPYYMSNCKITEKDTHRKLAGETANVQTMVFSPPVKVPLSPLTVVELWNCVGQGAEQMARDS